MRRFGVKLWSKDFVKNPKLVDEIEKALKEEKFGYLELFALPDSFDEVKEKAKRFVGISAVIHAPHIGQDFDPSLVAERALNQKRFADSQRFADLLNASIIITHPGVRYNEESLAENLHQFREFNEARIAVENLPYVCSATKKELMGATPLEIKPFIEELKCQFCFDFSHAVCSANSLNRDVYEVLTEFKALKPAMYHLCDGDEHNTIDAHLHYGEGNYDLRRMLTKFTDKNAIITMETGKGLPVNVQPWLDDAAYLARLE